MSKDFILRHIMIHNKCEIDHKYCEQCPFIIACDESIRICVENGKTFEDANKMLVDFINKEYKDDVQRIKNKDA